MVKQDVKGLNMFTLSHFGQTNKNMIKIVLIKVFSICSNMALITPKSYSFCQNISYKGH